MVSVHINGELYACCETVLPDRWNGWVVPIFNDDQMGFVIRECERLGWVGESDLNVFMDSWDDLGNGEWMTSGWCWEVCE